MEVVALICSVIALILAILAYFYKVMRYLTFNEDRVPFPFSRFPEEIEKPELK